MKAVDNLVAGEVGNGSRNLQNLVVRPCGKPKTFKGSLQGFFTPLCHSARVARHRRAELGVAAYVSILIPPLLNISRRDNPLSNFFGAFAFLLIRDSVVVYGG